MGMLPKAISHSISAGDFEQADTIRDQLVELGYVVEDRPDGTRVRPRSNGC